MKRMLALALLLSPTAIAQTPTPTPPPPGCTAPAYRDFDFWLGEWTVTGPAGTKAGENSITSQEGGCLIVERWTSAGNGSGQSYNFYDPGTMQWRQLWVSGSSVIDYSGGLNAKGEMVLRGQIRYRDGRSAPFMGVWSKQPDGTIRQHFQEFDLPTQQWTDWFTGTYRRKP
jgi:hypothetical protein